MQLSALRLAKSSIAGILIVLLAAPLAHAAPVLPQNHEAQNHEAQNQEAQNQDAQNREAQNQEAQNQDAQNREAQNQQQAQAAQQPPAPNATAQNATPDAPSPQLADPSTRTGNLQSDQQQNTNPVGTAAAPVAKPTGVAASRPAGAVIAPAKQRRTRSIAIRVGILVGAGIAVGTVAALSRSSSGRP